MAREIVVKWNECETTFSFAKVDRAKLYGKKRRIPVDKNGNPCESANLEVETGLLLRSGMVAQGYFVEGKWIPNKELVGIDGAGNELDLQPSTLGVTQELNEAQIEDVFDLKISSVYALESGSVDPNLQKALDEGRFFSVPFNYRADYQVESGMLIGDKRGGVFLLVGQPAENEWISFEVKVADEMEESDVEDDLDFEMF